MSEHAAALLGILATAAGAHAARLTGYFLGSRVRTGSTTSRVLDSLPGAALAAVLALSLLHAAPVDFIPFAVTVGLYLWWERTLPALCAGLAVAIANAHWLT